MKADTKAIQAIHTHVITHNPRVHVSFDDHSTWHLLIKQVTEEDKGPYMCQINTDPMISQVRGRRGREGKGGKEGKKGKVIFMFVFVLCIS